MRPLILILSLLLPLALSLTLQEDDLVFDDVGEETAAPTVHLREDRRGHPRDYERLRENKKHEVERLWGIPDAAVMVAHIFKMKIPKQAFSGNVDHYEVRGSAGLPRWLQWDEAASTFSGVPSKRDIGHHHINVRAFGKRGDVAKDVFTIDVVAGENDGVTHKDKKTHCSEDQDPTLLTLVLATRFESLRPAEKVNAIENLAGFLGLHTSAFSIHPHASKETSVPDASVILSGPGNVRHRKEKHTTAIHWQVGCDGHLWHHQTDLVKQLREQAKDGTLAEVLQQPVLFWKVKTDSSLLLRNRRDTGSGNFDYDDYNYDDYDEENDGEDEDDNEAITMPPAVGLGRTGSNSYEGSDGYSLGHPHRHHHGEETIDTKPQFEEVHEDDVVPVIAHTVSGRMITTTPISLNTTEARTTTQQPATTPTTTPTTTTSTTTLAATTTTSPTTTTPAKTTTITTTTTTTTTTMAPSTEPPEPETTEEPEERNKQNEIEFETIPPITNPEPSTPTPTPTTTSTTTTTPSTTTTTEKPATEPVVVIVHSTTTEEEMEESTAPPTMVPTLSPSTTTSTTTTTLVPSTVTVPTTTTTTTETIVEEVKNFEPHLDKPLRKSAVTAGKQFNFIIPRDTFSDMEDGDTRNLDLEVYLNGKVLERTHWLQFNKDEQKVYGLPLKKDIFAYVYEVNATDSEGLTKSDSLEVTVQQHRQDHSFNHEFSMELSVNSKFPTHVDWALKVIQNLNELYGDRDTNKTKITVQAIEFGSTPNRYTFTWSNDSVPRGAECPKEQIEQLLQVLALDKEGRPSEELMDVLGPDFSVVRVVYRGKGQCEQPVTMEPQHKNLFPIPRNQVDHINATVGELLVLHVPLDTFYDPEDGSARNMKMYLLSINRTAIPQDHWLQFESNNQEFFGVPAVKDIGRKDYQLVVTDKEGATATDVLVVVVRPAPPVNHNIEFSMTLEHPYETFVHSAIQQRKFIEHLKGVFGDNTTDTIRLSSITNGSTIVTWYNTTLPTSYCPMEKVKWIESILVGGGKAVAKKMGSEFIVKQITLTPMGWCLGEMTVTHNETHESPNTESDSLGKHDDDYLITFVLPAILIAAMLILAAIIACVLYRRKRSGKMSVSEQDDERQSFRNKGIPVIFQDELDEKPDPGNKSPVILKEEKPPLPPPEYQKTEDGANVPMLQKENSEEPYQPPPPFATNRDNNRQNRPKPTPTYRKPPPYVPP